MANDKDHDLDVVLPPAEAAQVLRRMADQIEQGRLSVGPLEVVIDGNLRFKQSVKVKRGKTSCKFKLEYNSRTLSGEVEAPADRPEPAGETSFGKLKKTMAKQIKALKQPLAMGSLPGLELTQAFVDDCRLMCSFPGKGEENYARFLAHAEALARAVEAADQPAASQAVDAMLAMKKTCHAALK